MDSHIPGFPQDPDPVEQLKLDIRAVLHDVTNPLGVVRMATYYLQTANPDDAKRTHYYALIAQSLDRIDGQLKRLRDLLVLSSGAGVRSPNRLIRMRNNHSTLASLAGRIDPPIPAVVHYAPGFYRVPSGAAPLDELAGGRQALPGRGQGAEPLLLQRGERGVPAGSQGRFRFRHGMARAGHRGVLPRGRVRRASEYRQGPGADRPRDSAGRVRDTNVGPQDRVSVQRGTGRGGIPGAAFSRRGLRVPVPGRTGRVDQEPGAGGEVVHEGDRAGHGLRARGHVTGLRLLQHGAIRPCDRGDAALHPPGARCCGPEGESRRSARARRPISGSACTVPEVAGVEAGLLVCLQVDRRRLRLAWQVARGGAADPEIAGPAASDVQQRGVAAPRPRGDGRAAEQLRGDGTVGPRGPRHRFESRRGRVPAGPCPGADREVQRCGRNDRAASGRT